MIAVALAGCSNAPSPPPPRPTSARVAPHWRRPDAPGPQSWRWFDAFSAEGEGLRCANSGDRAHADAWFSRAIELFAANPGRRRELLVLRGYLRSLDTPCAALADFDAAVELGETREHVLLERAVLRAKLGERERALTELAAIVAAAPEYAEAHGERAYVLCDLGRDDDAVTAASEALRLDPDRVQWHLLRAWARVRSGDPAGALDDARRAVAFAPTRGAAHAAVADAAWRVARWDEAERAATEALRLGFDDPRVFEARARARAALRDHAGAVEDWTEVLRRWRGLSFGYTERAWSRRELNDLAGAQEDCDRALELAPKDAWAYEVRADVRHHQGDHEGAVADATAALELQPELGWARFVRVLANVERQQWTSAEADLGALIKLEPEDPLPYRIRWYVRWKLGDRVGGRADYKKWKALRGNSTAGSAE